MRYRLFLAMFAFTACMPAPQAAQPAPAGVRVDDAWVRGTVARQRATGAFMRLTASAPARLLAARSPAAQRVELHEMRMVGDVMRMREVDAIALVPGQTVELAPSGYHIMLLGLAKQASAGELIPLSLVFEDAGGRRFSIEVSARVRALGAAQGPQH